MGRPRQVLEVRGHLELAYALLEFLRREYQIPKDDPILKGIPEDAVHALLNRRSVPDPKKYLKKAVRDLLFAKFRKNGP